MNFLIAFACLVFVYSANALDKEFKDKFMEKVQKLGAQCLQEENGSEEDVASLLAHQVPASHEGKCVIFCMDKAFKFLKDDGTIDEEGTLQTMAPVKLVDSDLYDKMHQVFITCKDSFVLDKDPCITASNYAVCSVEEGKKLGLEDLMEM